MLSKEYEFYGFKLYQFTLHIETRPPEELIYNVIVQYHAGVIINTWKNQIVLDNKTNEQDGNEKWSKTTFPIWNDKYEFIRNLSEDEIFLLLL